MPNLRSPQYFAQKLAKQWQQSKLRRARLLGDDGAYPIRLPIPAPSTNDCEYHLPDVKAHLQAWQAQSVGNVIWTERNYRSLAQPLSVPRCWEITSPSEWIAACNDPTVTREYQHYARIIQQVSPCFHRLLISQKKLIMERDSDSVIRACRLAEQLEPDIACGSPLRTLAMAGIDSKFFERHRKLLVKLLDLRFDGEVSRLGRWGLEAFLGASKDEHWVLLLDLDGNLLPFSQQKVRVPELRDKGLPAADLLIIENVQVIHLLPQLPDTIAVLGAGLDLAWLQAEWLNHRRIRYWGDMDTWGLAMLARARSYRSDIQSILMNAELFHKYQHKAVPEPCLADNYIADVFSYLSDEEHDFYHFLQSAEHGRLEQEFILSDDVLAVLSQHPKLSQI